MVRIVDIREDVASMRSNIRNAFIDFSKMTSSSECVSDCVWTEREREREHRSSFAYRPHSCIV